MGRGPRALFISPSSLVWWLPVSQLQGYSETNAIHFPSHSKRPP